MPGALLKRAARFGFRTDQGLIDAKTWRQGSVLLAVPLAVLTFIWLLWAPFVRPLAEAGPPSYPEALAAYGFLLIYGFAVLFGAIAHYNLSVKRWRDRGWTFPEATAALLPLSALFSGAAHLVQPRVADVMPYWHVLLMDLALAAVIAWNAVELGWLGGRSK
jgi:uncharacterized membrane protein YhaH (DUF805 family)